MKRNMLAKLYRIIILVTVFAIVAMAVPQSVQAASPSIKIVSVKAGESVTVSAANFPAGVKVTVKMDKSGTTAVNGIVAGDTNSGTNGSFEATYKIPAELKDRATIAIRLEAPGGFYAYDWFSNKTGTITTNTDTTTTTPVRGTPSFKIIAVDENSRITVKATNFPADTTFTVKVGPYHDFKAKSSIAATIYTKTGGTFEFNVDLPESVIGVDLVTVRIEGKKLYVYNAFTNEDKGTINPNPTVNESLPAGSSCEMVLINPAKTTEMTTRYDFDGAWTIKNTSDKDWFLADVDYKYISGAQLHREKDVTVYDLGKTVKPGETIKILVDMITPDTVGTYTTEWAVVTGSTTLCSLPLTITVK